MPPFGPISRRDLIGSLQQLGFSGPYAGGKHEFLVKGTLRLILPNLHGGDIDRALLSRILKQAAVSREEWEAL